MDEELFISDGEKQSGPFTLGQLNQMWKNGSVSSKTLYWTNGNADWLPLKALMEPKSCHIHEKQGHQCSGPHVFEGSFLGDGDAFRLVGDGTIRFLNETVILEGKPLLWYRWLLLVGVVVPFAAFGQIQMGPLGLILFWYPISKLRGKMASFSVPRTILSFGKATKSTIILIYRNGQFFRSRRIVFQPNDPREIPKIAAEFS